MTDLELEAEPYAFLLKIYEKLIFIIRGDGNVEFGEGITPNEASLEFYKQLKNHVAHGIQQTQEETVQ